MLLAARTPGPPLSAFVDRTDISINDIITLTIRTDAKLGNTRPSMEGLNRNFEQVGGSSTRARNVLAFRTAVADQSECTMQRPNRDGVADRYGPVLVLA